MPLRQDHALKASLCAICKMVEIMYCLVSTSEIPSSSPAAGDSVWVSPPHRYSGPGTGICAVWDSHPNLQGRRERVEREERRQGSGEREERRKGSGEREEVEKEGGNREREGCKWEGREKKGMGKNFSGKLHSIIYCNHNEIYTLQHTKCTINTNTQQNTNTLNGPENLDNGRIV